jgi:hypothetical protein
MNWPHFTQRFLKLESTLSQFQDAYFGHTLRDFDMPAWNTLCRQQFTIATNAVSIETVTALGWHLSWLGVARTCDSVHRLSTPALGLSGWLAHSPDRPLAIAYAEWTDQLIAWLQEDLTTSACYGIASRRSCDRTSPITCTRLSRARLNLPRGAQVNRIGMASRHNRLKISPLKASSFRLNGTTLRQ